MTIEEVILQIAIAELPDLVRLEAAVAEALKTRKAVPALDAAVTSADIAADITEDVKFGPAKSPLQ